MVEIIVRLAAVHAVAEKTTVDPRQGALHDENREEDVVRRCTAQGLVRTLKGAARLVGTGAGVALAGYALYAGHAFLRYGRILIPPEGGSTDPIMDRFMPIYDVVERHHIEVAAPAEVTLAAAKEQELTQVPLVRAVFKARELVMGSDPGEEPMPAGLLDMTLSIGWRILHESSGREVVLGAVTEPWEANVIFRGLPPEQFAAFWSPGHVKIIWSLRADPLGPNRSVFHTETRAVATDRTARTRFRRYWSLASPGIWLIRWLSLRPLQVAAERRQATVGPPT